MKRALIRWDWYPCPSSNRSYTTRLCPPGVDAIAGDASKVGPLEMGNDSRRADVVTYAPETSQPSPLTLSQVTKNSDPL